MKTLWSPWRLDHVLGNCPPPEHCIFEPMGESISDKNQLLLYRDSYTVVLLNRFPYTNGHLLVAPARHVDCITRLTVEENCTLMTMVSAATGILKQQFSPDGFNIGCNLGATAGAGIADHLHFHVVPRWDGDHNFIAVIGELRTIPEHIEVTFDNLAADFLDLHRTNNP